MKKDVYPTTLEFYKSISEGGTSFIQKDNIIIDARKAIHLKLSINGNEYPINEIKVALKELFEKVDQCFGE